jgi:cystathionine beta-synthase
VLPDGGRGYLSKIFNDDWMDQYGFLERTGERHVGDVLRAKTAAGEIPPFVVVETHQTVRDAIALLHEHRVSQLPVVDESGSVVGSVGERGLLKSAIDNPHLMGTAIAEAMEAPFPSVGNTDPVNQAVELLAGEGSQAVTVSDGDRPVGIVTRADLLEALIS